MAPNEPEVRRIIRWLRNQPGPIDLPGLICDNHPTPSVLRRVTVFTAKSIALGGTGALVIAGVTYLILLVL